jgi:hypothetical protein
VKTERKSLKSLYFLVTPCLYHVDMAKRVSLADADPELAKQAYGWDPKTISAGSGKKVKWKCDKDHIWESLIATRFSQKPRFS